MHFGWFNYWRMELFSFHRHIRKFLSSRQSGAPTQISPAQKQLGLLATDPTASLASMYGCYTNVYVSDKRTGIVRP